MTTAAKMIGCNIAGRARFLKDIWGQGRELQKICDLLHCPWGIRDKILKLQKQDLRARKMCQPSINLGHVIAAGKAKLRRVG